MSRCCLFGILAFVSLLACAVTTAKSVERWYHYVPEAQRVRQRYKSVIATISKGWGTPEYFAAVDRNRKEVEPRWDYVNSHLAEIAFAERWEYVTKPRLVALTLAMPSIVWLLANWWRLRSKPPVPWYMRWVQRLPRTIFSLSALASLIWAISLSRIWARSYQAGEIYYLGDLTQEGDDATLTQRQLSISQGRFIYASAVHTDRWGIVTTEMDMNNLLIVGASTGYAHFALLPSLAPNAIAGSHREILGLQWAVQERRERGPIGLEAISGVFWMPANEFLISAPFWLVELVLLSVPIYWISTPTSRANLRRAWTFFTTSRTKQGHCRQCGYNLTGNASGTCPECGTAVAKSSM